jgi:GTPase
MRPGQERGPVRIATSQPERALLATLRYSRGPEGTEESLAELARLTATAGGQVVSTRTFTRPRPEAAGFFGSGQVQELGRLAQEHGADLLIVDHELRPIQQRNLEQALSLRVIDRTQLILDIFARRARSHEGQLQVELAQLSYLLPRLTGKGIELSRLGGGIGTRGPGESKLEYDRRRVRFRITVLKRQLETLKRTRSLHRQDRAAVPLPLVSLVGYTNAGKSALLNALTGERTLVEDKLFATLDLATRRWVLPPGLEVLLTDTVGFIRRLPHYLVAAFRGTLEEVVNADVLVHVVDASAPGWEGQASTVQQVLGELAAGEKPVVLAFNKVDLVRRSHRIRLAHHKPRPVLVSARTGEGLDDLRAAVAERLSATWERMTVRLPYDRADLRALVLRRGRLLREIYGQKGITLRVQVPPRVAAQLREYLRK